MSKTQTKTIQEILTKNEIIERYNSVVKPLEVELESKKNSAFKQIICAKCVHCSGNKCLLWKRTLGTTNICSAFEVK